MKFLKIGRFCPRASKMASKTQNCEKTRAYWEKKAFHLGICDPETDRISWNIPCARIFVAQCYMYEYDHVWLSMTIFDYVWQCMTINALV